MNQNLPSSSQESIQKQTLDQEMATPQLPADEANTKGAPSSDEKPKIQYFQCSTCILREKYEYFGKSPPFVKDYRLEEDAYVIEDPFLPPKRGEFLILGAHCVKCSKAVCKDSNCSFYFGGTYCLKCAKECCKQFPAPVQEKLNRVVVPL